MRRWRAVSALADSPQPPVPWGGGQGWRGSDAGFMPNGPPKGAQTTWQNQIQIPFTLHQWLSPVDPDAPNSPVSTRSHDAPIHKMRHTSELLHSQTKPGAPGKTKPQPNCTTQINTVCAVGGQDEWTTLPHLATVYGTTGPDGPGYWRTSTKAANTTTGTNAVGRRVGRGGQPAPWYSSKSCGPVTGHLLR